MTTSTRRMNSRQRERLVDLVEANIAVLYSNNSQNTPAKIKVWQTIRASLNKLGPEKTSDQWKKAWTDLKSMVKKKAVKLKAIKSANYPVQMQLSDEEYQVLRVRDRQILEDLSHVTNNFSYLVKMNESQRDWLLELVQRNAAVLCGPNLEKRFETWSVIASTLNGMGNKKTSKQWRKIWLDLMKEIKGKAESPAAAVTSGNSKNDEITNKDLELIEICETEQVESAQANIPKTLFDIDTSTNSNNLPQAVPITSSLNCKHLKWNDHSQSIINYQKILKCDQQTCDVTLVFNGKSVKAHRFILSACSTFFFELLRDVPVGQDATIIVPDVDGRLLDSLLNFIYMGETSVDLSKLTEFLDAISVLAIKSPISFERGNISVSCDAPINTNDDVVEIDAEDDEEQTNPKEMPNAVSVAESIELDTEVKEEILEDYETTEYDEDLNKNDENLIVEDTLYEEHLLDENPDMDIETDIDRSETNIDDPLGEPNSDPDWNPIKIESSDDDYDAQKAPNEISKVQAIHEKVIRLRADEKKSLMVAYYAHTQKGMNLMKAAAQHNVSWKSLHRMVVRHRKKPRKSIKKSSSVEALNNTNVARIRRNIRIQTNPLNLSDIKFLKLFNMSKEVFLFLLDEIREKLPESTRSTSVPPTLKLAATLRFLVDGGFQKRLEDDFQLGLAQPTLSRIFTEVLTIFEEHICPKWIKFEQTDAEKRQAKLYFYKQAGIPGVIGCVDATHIHISGFTKLDGKYLNKKGYNSLNALLVCDHRMFITFIDARHPGPVHESVVWNSSNLRRVLKEKYDSGTTNTWLLGDVGFPLEPYLLTPFKSPEVGSKESTFNQKHSKTKNIIGKTISILKNRFRSLSDKKPLCYSPEKSTQIVNVCAALHNICMHYKSYLPEEENVDDTEKNSEPETLDDEVVIKDNAKAVKIRNQVLNAILTI